MKSLKKDQSGQAVIEYLLVFAFLGIIGVNMVKFMGETMGNNVTRLAYVLSQHLHSGVCEELCFYGGFVNKARDDNE